MSYRIKIILITLAVVLLVGIVIVPQFIIPYFEATETFTNEYKEPVELAVGDTAPDFSVKLVTGETFTLSDYKGKVVFLNFWATWCSPCVAEMPAIQKLSEQYKEDVVFIGVDLAENPNKVKNYIESKGYTYNIGLDETGEISRRLYPTEGIPYTLIVNEKGIITKIFLGGGSQMHGPFEDAIKKALDR